MNKSCLHLLTFDRYIHLNNPNAYQDIGYNGHLTKFLNALSLEMPTPPSPEVLTSLNLRLVLPI